MAAPWWDDDYRKVERPKQGEPKVKQREEHKGKQHEEHQGQQKLYGEQKAGHHNGKMKDKVHSDYGHNKSDKKQHVYGYEKGKDRGCGHGYDRGYGHGYNRGYEHGYGRGYERGYDCGVYGHCSSSDSE